MNVKQILDAVKSLAPKECDCLIAGLPVVLPIQALATLAAAVYDELNARNEAEQLRAAANAVDAAIDVEEAELLK